MPSACMTKTVCVESNNPTKDQIPAIHHHRARRLSRMPIASILRIVFYGFLELTKMQGIACAMQWTVFLPLGYPDILRNRSRTPMRKPLAVLMLMLVATSLGLSAAQQPPNSGAAFHKLQTLAGDWEGKDDEGNPAKTTFKVVVGSTAVMETLTAHGMEEMLTLYSVDGDGISLLHYCPTNNQPHMRAVPGSGDPRELVFSFQGATNLASPAVGHEHKLVMEFEDNDHITERWTWRKAGKDSETVYKFVRQSNGMK